MDNQPINEPNVQQGSKIIWTIVAVVVITAIIAGAGVWWWQKASFEKERQGLQEQIDDLKRQISGIEEDELKDWKTYRNEEYGFEVRYPGEWILKTATQEQLTEGEIISLESSDTQQLLQEKKIVPGYSRNIVISYWSDINNSFAKGGEWIGQWQYKNLADYFSDEMALKKKIGDLTIGNQKAYEVTIGGMLSNHGIMIEHNGIYELSFERSADKSKLGSIENQILSTFKFIE